ncbi:MAG: acetolactate decarboxylase [Desulfovibrionaceae bacterium]|nr:acetolactate decarboxylase [Desulfovibrionaceae bacterium]MBF0513190.1 acetolactate decarboxylase [Desulfovibrionaceae bacterium]
MKRRLSACLVLLCVALTAVAHGGEENRLWQYSTIGALLRGGYAGCAAIGDVLRRGDCGLGTLDGLDGEMICLKAKCFQIKSDGKAYAVAADATAPFVQIAAFAPQIHKDLEPLGSIEAVEKALNALLPSRNLFAMAVLKGRFARLTARSVPRQARPFPPLGDVVKRQAVFEFGETDGTVLAIYQPAYVGQIGVPGWHMHFLTKDETAGGHVLDLAPQAVTLELQILNDFSLILPDAGDFLTLDLDPKQPDTAVDAVERMKK